MMARILGTSRVIRGNTPMGILPSAQICIYAGAALGAPNGD
jgi:Fe2+ transport system protein FeoA